MIKSITLLKRKPGITQEEFDRYWKEKHGPLAAALLPGLRKYIQDHLIEMPGLKYEFDGIAEIYFDNVEALQKYLAWRQTKEGKALLDDEKKFFSGMARYVVEEHVMK